MLQVARDAHVGDRHETEPGILDPPLESLRNDDFDAVGELAGSRWICHLRTPSILRFRDAPAALLNHQELAGLFLELDRLDLVTDLDVVELTETNTGFEVGLDLSDVVLEAAQALDRKAVAHDDAVADDPRLGVSRDGSASHDDSRNVA